MIDTKLILIEGIAGSGKSTTGQRIYRLLHLNGRATEYYHEFHRPHPVLEVEADSVTEWMERSIAKWRGFIQHMSGQESVAIVDGAVFQCGAGELLERDADVGIIKDYLLNLIELLKPLRPVLIHLYQKDLDTALKYVCGQRPAAWRERVFRMFSDVPYGRNRTLKGFDLYLDFNRSLRQLADSSFETLAIPKLMVENSDHQWEAHLDKICRFLDIPQVADPFHARDYQGEYEEQGGDRRCQVKSKSGALRVEGLFTIPKDLLPKRDDTFFVQTWPDELTFTRDRAGTVVSFSSTGPWNRLGDKIWVRINPDQVRL